MTPVGGGGPTATPGQRPGREPPARWERTHRRKARPVQARPAPVAEFVPHVLTIGASGSGHGGFEGGPGRAPRLMYPCGSGLGAGAVVHPYNLPEMSTDPVQPRHSESLELPVDELLRRARPLPPHEEMVIENLSEQEGAAFLAALAA